MISLAIQIMRTPTNVVCLLKALMTTAFLSQSLATQAQGVIFNVGFEAPTYSPGFIGAGNYPGQDNWTGFGYQFVTNSQAHTGGQSLITTSGGTVAKSFSSLDGTMNIGKANNWYMQTWVYVLPGANTDATSFAAASGLGSAFYVGFYGDGRIEFNSGVALQSTSYGSSLFNKWLRVTIDHPALDPNLEMSVVGEGVNATFSGFYSTPWSPSVLAVSGPTAYWDDMIAVDNAVAPVPEPATVALVGLGLAPWAFKRRRQ